MTIKITLTNAQCSALGVEVGARILILGGDKYYLGEHAWKVIAREGEGDKDVSVLTLEKRW